MQLVLKKLKVAHSVDTIEPLSPPVIESYGLQKLERLSVPQLIVASQRLGISLQEKDFPREAHLDSPDRVLPILRDRDTVVNADALEHPADIEYDFVEPSAADCGEGEQCFIIVHRQ